MAYKEVIFLTGFPGFISGHLLQRLAVEGAWLLLLVQPSFRRRAVEQIRHLAAETGTSESNFEILEGDIALPDLGLSSHDLEKARAETTTVFHLAAIYDLAVARDLAMKVNVEGTRNVNRFVRTLPHLRRYHYVSTCFVSGRRQGLILETELRHEDGFRNHYEESKYLAELEVDSLKEELPVTIHRPAVVCGDSRTGKTVKYDGVYYLIRYLLKAPRLVSPFNIGNSKVKLNLVPVDFVAEGMVALAKDERAEGKTVQLADPNPLTTEELFDSIVSSLNGGRSKVTIPSPVVHFTLSLPLSPAITGLPHHGVPYFFVKQTYDTRQAGELLEPHGIHCPPFPSYAKAITDFAARNPRL